MSVLLSQFVPPSPSFVEGHGNPLQCSCLENPMDRGTWQATVCGITKSWTQLKQLRHAHPFLGCAHMSVLYVCYLFALQIVSSVPFF